MFSGGTDADGPPWGKAAFEGPSNSSPSIRSLNTPMLFSSSFPWGFCTLLEEANRPVFASLATRPLLADIISRLVSYVASVSVSACKVGCRKISLRGAEKFDGGD